MGQAFNHRGPQLGTREALPRAGLATRRGEICGLLVVAVVFVVTPGTEAGDGNATVGSTDAATIASVEREGINPSPTMEPVGAGLIPDRTSPSSAGASLADGVTSPAIEPWIQTRMPPKVEEKLRAALDLAGRRIREVPECGELFTELGADGIETLRTTFYFPVLSYEAGLTSCRKAVAFSYVGEAPTYLCNGFSRLSDERAAMVVVHEALHHAGLTEQPLDPKGMTSRAINVMVRKGCDF